MTTDQKNTARQELDHILNSLTSEEGWRSRFFWTESRLSNSGFPELSFFLDLSGVSGVCN